MPLWVLQYCVQPWVVEEARNIASYEKMVADLNKVGKIMKENGIQFGYHNHNFEFDTLEGKVPYFDILMAGFDKDLVTMEIDLFWTIKAGHNPVDIFNKYPGRFQILHMKDAYTRKLHSSIQRALTWLRLVQESPILNRFSLPKILQA